VTILTDTNVLVPLMNEKHGLFGSSWAAVNHLLNGGDSLAVTSQNLVELWSVCTRPIDVRGLGLSRDDAVLALDRIELQFLRLADSDEVYPAWKRLVRDAGVAGRQVHDARLVACMLVHGVTHILTFNGRDFTRYREIAAIDPIAISRH
jgi:predicted nucleic acid-binding protein